MGKAIFTLLVTLIIGIISMVFSIEILNDSPTLGVIVAVAVMGALVVYFNEKKK